MYAFTNYGYGYRCVIISYSGVGSLSSSWGAHHFKVSGRGNLVISVIGYYFFDGSNLVNNNAKTPIPKQESVIVGNTFADVMAFMSYSTPSIIGLDVY